MRSDGVLKCSLDRLSLEDTLCLEEQSLNKLLGHYRKTCRVDVFEQRYYEFLREYNLDRQYGGDYGV